MLHISYTLLRSAAATGCSPLLIVSFSGSFNLAAACTVARYKVNKLNVPRESAILLTYCALQLYSRLLRQIIGFYKFRYGFRGQKEVGLGRISSFRGGFDAFIDVIEFGCFDKLQLP